MDMDNLQIYNAVRSVPPEAQKPIQGGRLKGKTDINPMWRIKSLTEQFGVCGIGWKPVIKRSWTENGANGEVAAFVEMDLFVKVNGAWSDAIPGTGGSMLIEKESSGLHTSDECYKMAYTDAISVACKALGFGADVYWEKDSSKYDKPHEPPKQQKEYRSDQYTIPALEKAEMLKLAKEKGVDMKVKGKEWTGKESSVFWTEEDFKKVMEELRK
jgi:hypothetical protein